MPPNRFFESSAPPIWEGLVFPKIDRRDPRLKMKEAKPHPELATYVQSVWWMEWDIPDGEQVVCIAVPNPCVKIGMVLRDQKQLPLPPRIDQVRSQSQFCTFENKGHAVCLEFKAGGFFPFSESVTANTLPLLEKMSESPLSEWLEKVENVLLNSPLRNHHLPQIQQIIEKLLLPEPEAETQLAQRTQQRIFQHEVGLSLRSVKQIARVNRSLRSLGGHMDALVEVAMNIGYADQAHMNSEFRKLLASKPSQFRTYT